jgi:predicted RNA-binding Zn ribbon-like protein
MTDQRPAPFFVADHLALDFLNSVAHPWGHKVEWLADGDDLLAWLEQAQAAPPAELRRLRAEAGVRKLDGLAREARDLREWFRQFVSGHAGRRLRSRALAELAPLNELLRQDEAYPQIEIATSSATKDQGDAGHAALRWRRMRRWSGVEALLMPIAEAMGDLVCEEDFALVRQCEGPSCSLFFLDISKGHARRWCSMALCGNRAKAAAHRARARGGGAGNATRG